MNKNSEKIFTEKYEADVIVTHKKIVKYPHSMYMALYPSPDEDIPKVRPVSILSIEIPEDKYKRFIDDYENYLDIMDQLSDPIVREEFYKLLVLVQLKK
jgi:hypothetical protein